MKYVAIGCGALLSLMGFLWILQGLGIVGGSMMSGQSFWAGAGLVALLAGCGLLFFGLRGRGVGPG